MIARLLKDPVVLTSLAMAAAVAAFYVVPGVSHDVLLRLGDKYSTLPLWPWAIVASLVGLRNAAPAWARRMLRFQAASFVCLLAIEAARAAAGNTATLSWDIAGEWMYLLYYAMQLLSADEALGIDADGARRRHTARIATVVACALGAFGLTLCAIYFPQAYAGVLPSYVVYLALDLAVACLFFRAGAATAPAWRSTVRGLALASALFFATDLLDLLYYRESRWSLETGTAWDLLWTLPALCFIVAIRIGRLHEASAVSQEDHPVHFA